MEDFELVSNASGMDVLLNELMRCLKNSDIRRFQDILEHSSNLNLDYHFGDPYYGTLLDKCCMEYGYYLFVELLLNHDANPNIVNKDRKKAPIHFAVQNNDQLTLRSLLECKKTNVNIIDGTGSSPLHHAVKLVDTEILKMLLECDKIDVNILNKKSKSPLLTALELKNVNKNCILALLRHPKLNLYSDPEVDKIKNYLNELIPEWESFITKRSTPPPELSFSYAFSLLDSGKYQEFISVIREKKDDSKFMEGNNGTHTFLQYSCEYGLVNIVSELLNIRVNPNTTSSTVVRTPLMIAAYKGYANIVDMLLRTHQCSFDQVAKETVLHCVVKGSAMQNPTSPECDHFLCLNLLLAEPRVKDIINQGDFKGNTPLHYAAKLGENEMILCLLKTGASLSCFNFLNEPAFVHINYKTLKKYLDSCITTNDNIPRDESYEITLNYSCLRPVTNNSDELHNRGESTFPPRAANVNNFCDTFESKPLLYIAKNNELKHLLKHPLFTSFLYLKWCRIKTIFFLNLAFYLSFIIGLAYYIVNDYQNVIKNSAAMKNWLWYVLMVYLVVLIFRELAQFLISPLKYLSSLENYLEIAIIYLTTKILCFAEGTSFEDKIKFSVICIMLSWGELVLLIGRHHACSTYIEMLKTVSWNFLKFLGWYSFLIVAFSLSFYVLFGVDKCSLPNRNNSSDTNDECTLKKNDTEENDNFFSSPLGSLFKTAIMLTGEFDASSVPFVNYPVLSHALFTAFLFFIAIVLFNLLNGLAVSDTQAIQSDSELVSYISRVKLLAFIETLVIDPISNKKGNNFNLFSCWERSTIITYCKSKLIPKCINLFQKGCLEDDCEIKILPFYGNQVQMGNSKYTINRKEDELSSNCYKKSGLIKMDSEIIHAVNEVLLEKHIEEKIKDDERKKEKNEQLCMEMIRYCYMNITDLKKIVQENTATLDKLVQR